MKIMEGQTEPTIASVLCLFGIQEVVDPACRRKTIDIDELERRIWQSSDSMTVRLPPDEMGNCIHPSLKRGDEYVVALISVHRDPDNGAMIIVNKSPSIKMFLSGNDIQRSERITMSIPEFLKMVG